MQGGGKGDFKQQRKVRGPKDGPGSCAQQNEETEEEVRAEVEDQATNVEETKWLGASCTSSLSWFTWLCGDCGAL